jgi:CRISPR-associated protein Csd2
LYVKKKEILANQQARAYKAVGMDAPPEDQEEDDSDESMEATPVKKAAKKEKAPPKKQADLEAINRAREFMFRTFWDISAFGAVFAGKGERALGQVTGPVQVTFAHSIDPIRVIDNGLTRVAVATVRESLDQGGNLNQTMGSKSIVPYGLYASKIFVSPLRAAQTGFSEKDLELFWSTLDLMWDHDHSAARGYMAMRKLIVFKHASPLGNASSRDLFNRITVQRKTGVDLATSFNDYDVNVDTSRMPGGVEVMTFPR